MTVSKPLRFVLQLAALFLIIGGAIDVTEGDTLGGATLIVIAAALWWLSRRRTAT